MTLIWPLKSFKGTHLKPVIISTDLKVGCKTKFYLNCFSYWGSGFDFRYEKFHWTNLFCLFFRKSKIKIVFNFNVSSQAWTRLSTAAVTETTTATTTTATTTSTMKPYENWMISVWYCRLLLLVVRLPAAAAVSEYLSVPTLPLFL